MLAELDVEYEQVVVDFTTGETATAEYRAINPMGKIPALVDGEVVITEAAAICAYLADKYADKGLAPAINAPQRGQYYRYLFYPGTVLEPAFTFNQLEGAELSPQSIGWGDMDRCFSTIDAMTPENDWALGSQFTTADIVYGGTLDFAAQFGWLQSPTPKVAAYIKRLKSRAAYKLTHDPSWH